MGKKKPQNTDERPNARFAWCLCDLEFTESHKACKYKVGDSTCTCTCHKSSE